MNSLERPWLHGFRLVSKTMSVAEISKGSVEELATILFDPAPPEDKGRFVTMGRAATMLGRGYFWLSRNWRRLGLHPSIYGKPIMFDSLEIERFLESHKAVLRGRPRRQG